MEHWDHGEPLSTGASMHAIREHELREHGEFELEGVKFTLDENVEVEARALRTPIKVVPSSSSTMSDGNKTRVPFGSSGSAGSSTNSSVESGSPAGDSESTDDGEDDEDMSFFFGAGGYDAKAENNAKMRRRRRRMDQDMKKDKKRYRSKLNIVVVHLDLGIGGAERLMVNVAISLLSLGHNVRVVTSHHDLDHCFEETVQGGVLGGKIDVYGDWLPRQVFGRFTAMCSVIRMVYISLMILAMHLGASFLQVFSSLRPSPRNQAGKSKWAQYQQHSQFLDAFPSHVDLVVIDGVSLPLPLFSWMTIPSIFYCHFPDKLLALGNTNHDSGLNANISASKPAVSAAAINSIEPVPSIGGRLRKHYREVLDRLEELTTGCAEVVMVNSQYTASVFKQAFTVLGRDVDPLVVYPTLEPPTLAMAGVAKGVAETDVEGGGESERDSKEAGREGESAATVLSYLNSDRPRYLLVSLNRYERKKRVDLAVEAFAELRRRPDSGANDAVLVIAGGYDGAVGENIEVLRELKDIAKRSGLQEGTDVVFRTSISSLERSHLLGNASALLYTPTNEHFGIVPLEAMKAGCPVIAVATGGPRETVLHNVTGLLVKQHSAEFAGAMASVLQCGEQQLPSSREGRGGKDSVHACACKYLMRSQQSSIMGAAGIAHVNANFHHRIMRQQFDMCLQVLVPDLISPLTSNLHVDNNGVTRYIGTTGARIRTSSNDDAAANFVPFDDGVTELTSASPSPAQSRGASPRQFSDQHLSTSLISIAAENGIKPFPPFVNDVKSDGKEPGKGSNQPSVSEVGSGPTATKKMNLVIPPYRGQTKRTSSSPEISPYNPAAIATSLKTGVNDRYQLYASHCAAVVRNWAISLTIVVAVPVLVVVCAI